MKTFRNFVGGAWVAPTSGAYYENRNPADWRDLIGRFPRSGPRDVELAARSALRGSGGGRRHRRAATCSGASAIS